MAKKIKASELTAELKNYMNTSKKPKTSENTNGGLSDELKSFLDNRKESGTLLSGALSDDEKQYYADKTAATKKQLYVASEREEAAKRAKVAEKKATTPTIDNVDTLGEKVSDNIGYLFDNAITGFQNSVDSLKGVVGAARESVTPTLYSLFDTKELGETGANMMVGLRKRTAPTLKTYKETIENGLGDYSNPVSAAKTTFSDEISQNLTDFYANESKSEERLQQLEEKYSDADIKSVTKFIGDAAYSGGYATASTVASMMTGGLAGPIVMATQSYGDAFNDAIKSGATRSEALEYAAREAINQGALDALFSPAGGFGEDLLMKGVSKATANPAVKTAVNYTVNALGEGVEEIAQSLVSTHNQRQTYDPDAEVDASDLLREGALGAFSGGVYGAMNIPSQVHEYTLEENKAKYEASTPERRKMLNDAANSDETNAVENLVSLLKSVGKNGSAEESVKKTIDMLTDEIKASNHILSTSKDVAVIERTKAERQNYMDMADAIRENRKSIIKMLQKEAGDSVSSEADTNAVSSDVSEPVESASTGDTVQLSAENAMPLAEQETAKKNTPLRTDERIRRSSSTIGADIYFESLATTAVEDLTVEDVVDAVQAARAKFPEQNPVDSILNRLNDRIESMRESENALSNPDLKETMRLQRERLETVEAYVRNNRAEIMANAMEANAVPVDVSQENIPRSDTSDENLARPSDEMEEAPAAAEAKSAKATDSAVPDGELRNAYDFLDDSDDVYASLDIYNAGDTEEAVNELLRHNGGLKGAVDAVRERIADLKKSGENTSEAEIKALEEIDSEIRKLAKPIANRATRVLNDSFKKMGIDARVVVDQSLAFDLSGNKPVTNASYDPKTNTIHVSPYATEFDAIASYVVHEMTHQARATGGSGIVSDLLTAKKLLEDKGAFKGYTREQIERGYSDQAAGRTEAGKKAFLDEEEAAYFLQSLLENRGGAFDALIREDRGLLQRIVDAIKDFFDRNGRKDRAVQRLIEKLESLANEAVAEAERTERRAKTSEVSVDTRATSDNAGVESDEEINEETEETGEDAEPLKPLEPLEDLTPGEDGVVYSEDGEPVADSAEDGSVRLSISLYDAEGRSEFRKFLNKSVASGRLTKEDARDMFDSIEEIYQICSEFKDKYAPFSTWSDAEVVRDTHGRPVFSVVTPNGEYKMNLDFSLVCKKRRTLDAVFNEMARRGIIDDFELGQKSVVKINEIIRNHGFETACALCFVDAKRFRQASMADQFVSLYNELVESLVPDGSRESIGYFNFSGNTSRTTVENGIDTWANGDLDFSHLDYVMKKYGKGTVEYKSARYIKNHPEARKLLQRGDFMSSGGFDAVKSQNPAIMKLYNSKKGTGGPKAAFGDVQYMNEIIKKAKTWTPEKAYSVGGIRIQSFSDYVPRLVFDYVQMIHDLAAVGLPAHAYTKEVLFAKQFGKTGIKINLSLIPAVSDNGIAPGLDADGNYVWAGESIDYDEAVAIQNADGYTENCGTICVGVSDEHIRKLLADPNIRMVIPYHKSGLNPIVAHMNKIDAFKDYTGSQNTLDENGKKLSEEFDFNKALRETGDPKKAVERYLEWVDKNGYTAKFNEFRGDPNYYKLLEDFTLFDRDGRYVPQRSVRAEFPKDGDAFGSMRSLIESGLQEDAVIEGKRDSELGNIVDEIERALPKTEAEIEETAVKQADIDVERDIRESRELDDEYMFAVERGDVETAQKMVDEAAKAHGYTVFAYHGTPTGGFTEFDPSRIGSNTGVGRGRFSFTSDRETANAYSGKDNKAARASELVTSLNKLFRKYDSEELRMLMIDDPDIPVVWDADIVIAEGANDGGYIEFDYDWEDNTPDLYADYKQAKEAQKLAEFEGTRRYLIDTLRDYRKGANSSLDGFFDDALTMLKTLSPDRTPMTYSVYLRTPTAEFDADSENYNSVAWDAAYSDADVAVIHLDNGEDRYFVSDPASIKSADPIVYDDNGNVIPLSERFNDAKTDIRYSRELETESERKIRRQQEKIEYLEKQLRSRTALGWAKAVSPSARRKFAASLAAEIPGVTVEEVSAKLKSVFDVFERPKKGSLDTPEVRFEEARKLAEEAAKELVGNAVQISIDPMWETYHDLRRYLRETAIKSNVSANEFGGEEDYRNWRQRNKGLLRISDAPNAIGVDMAYQELSAKYPEFFPEDIANEADQLKLLGKAAEELKQFAGSRTTKINPLEDVQESFAQDLVGRILYGFDALAETTRAASAELGVTVKEEEMRRVRAESERESAQREDAAYRRGVRKGMDSNDKLVQAEYERNQIEVQNMEREYRAARDNFNREIERQNQRIARLQKRIESRNETARLATERKKALASLNRLYAMLMNPNRSKHIPQNLRAPVARLLESLGTTRLPNGKTVTMDTMRNIQDAEYGRFEQDSIRAADDMERIIRASKTESGVTDQYLDKLTANIQHLKEIYGDINPEDPDAPMLPPDLMSSRKIDYIAQIGKILSMVEKYVKQSDMLFINDKAIEAHEFADGLIAELRSKQEKTQNQVRINLLRKYFDSVGYNFVNADLFFEMMGEHGVDLAHRYRRAQNVQAQSEEEYAEYMKRVTKDGYSTHRAGLNGDLIDIGNFEVSRAQLMQLYLTWQRPAGRRHLRKGGAVFTNALGEESSARKIEHITQQKYEELISHLTEEDKRIADAVGRFLTNQAARWGNEASMAMYGYRMFEDPHYFPMDVSKNVLPKGWDQMDDFWRLENAGMTKSLKGDASAPLRMTDMFDVADHHIRTMAAYRAYAPVSNDVQRIMDMPGVKEAVSYGMGQKGVEYLDDLIKTIASNKVRNGDMSDAAAPLQFFMNAYKRQAVSFNLSTAAKQPLSLLRAFNEMEPKYIMSANVSGEEYKRALAAMIENSGVAKMKMLGYSDTGFAKSLRQIYDSDYVNESGIIRGTLTREEGGRRAVKAYDKITDAGMWLAGKMDEVTWVRLWVACEKEISDKYPALKGDERMSKVAERFNDLIGRTQVVDTILDTSPLMRNNLMALFTPFMNEPTKALATILTAAEAVRDKRPYGIQKLKKAVGLVLLNNLVLEPIITTLFSMWRDEEDDTESLADFTEKFFKLYAGVDLQDGTNLTSIAISNAVGGIFGFPIIQIFYDTFSDASQNFSNEKIDTAALSNLVKSTKNLITNLPKKPEDRAKSNYKLMSEFIGAAAAAIGIPANTIRRQLSAVYRSIIELTDNYEAQWEYNKMLYNLENSSARSQKYFYDIMAAAYKAGDTEAYRAMREDLNEIVSDTPSVVSVKSIEKAIKERGGKIEVGSDLWYVDVQSRFYLDDYVPKMRAETLITQTYIEAQKAGVDPSSLLLTMPSAYEYTTLDGKEMKMNTVEYENYIKGVGLLSYQVLIELSSGSKKSAWNALTLKQRIYAIEKVYAYAKAKGKKDFDAGYNIRGQGVWMDEIYNSGAGQSAIASAIIAQAKKAK